MSKRRQPRKSDPEPTGGGILLSVVLALLSTAAFADTEFTLQTGVRFGETDQAVPVYGLTLDFKLAPERWFSILWSMQDTEIRKETLLPDSDFLDLDIHYLEFAGVYRPPPSSRIRWFVTAGAGVTWVSPQRSSFDDEAALALMVGGGTIVPLGKRIGLRFDARGHFTLSDIRLSGVCGGVACSINFASGGAFQFEALVGLSKGF